jgi:hypothetical protein
MIGSPESGVRGFTGELYEAVKRSVRQPPVNDRPDHHLTSNSPAILAGIQKNRIASSYPPQSREEAKNRTRIFADSTDERGFRTINPRTSAQLAKIRVPFFLSSNHRRSSTSFGFHLLPIPSCPSCHRGSIPRISLANLGALGGSKKQLGSSPKSAAILLKMAT